jgi:uncharacterized membrane protein YhdT
MDIKERKELNFMKNLNLESTDYDVKEITNYDRRFEAGKKDAIFFHGLGLIATILATICMYTFGTGDPANMRYFLGMPLWFSGAVVIYLVMFIIGITYLTKWEMFSLKAKELEKEVESK